MQTIEHSEDMRQNSFYLLMGFLLIEEPGKVTDMICVAAYDTLWREP